MQVIWVESEPEYFCERHWTGFTDLPAWSKSGATHCVRNNPDACLIGVNDDLMLHLTFLGPGSMKALTTLIERIGLDPNDSDETALRKRLAVVLCAGTLPLTLLWSAIYLAVGAPIAAAIPGFYTAVTPINTAIFARSRNFRFYRFTQLLLILLLPWLLTLSLGGFRQSSVVIIWAALCPLGSLLLEDLRSTLFWIVGFVVLLIADRFRCSRSCRRSHCPSFRDLVFCS